MSEDDWDAVIATHLKGTFTLFRAASTVMRAQKSGSLVGFTSAAFQASVAQANYSAAKGGIVSLVRSAAAGLHRYGVRANAVAPIARTRMMAEVPMELPETGEPEDVAPMVTYLLSDLATHITGQIYTVVGGKIAVWNQPHEVRAMYKEGRWTPEEIARRLDATIGQEPMPILAQLEAYRRPRRRRQKAVSPRTPDRAQRGARCPPSSRSHVRSLSAFSRSANFCVRCVESVLISSSTNST